MCCHVITVSNGNYPYVLSLFQMKKDVHMYNMLWLFQMFTSI